MTWYDTKQAAVDPDNPAANEQIPFSEWNTMVTYLKDKIIDKAVNDAAIANNRVLVYKTATSTFVFEDQSAVAAINDLTDVVISGVPADNEVLAYNTATSKWINQTAAEAALATTTDLASYLPLSAGSGKPLTDHLYMGGKYIYDLIGAVAYNTDGVDVRNSVSVAKIALAPTNYAFMAHDDAHMNSNKIISVTDPTSAQDAATKNYCDTRVATKELVTSFTNDYVLIYKTASGKFEMEEQSAALGLPVVDTTAIIKGSADGTKQIRFEVDGLTTGMTRVLTVQDKDYTICDKTEVALLNGVANVDMNGYNLNDIGKIDLGTETELTISGGYVVVSRSYHKIDTEGDASTDNLTHLTGGTWGQILIIRAANAGRTVVVKNDPTQSQYSIMCGTDFSLTSDVDTMTLLYSGYIWIEIARSDNQA